MLKSVFFAVLLSSAQCLRANEDVVSNVTFSQDPSTLQVTIGYSLAGDESKIITLDVLTNGVSIGFSNIRAAVGDVNRLVQPGENKRILWRPDKSWPGWLLPQNEVQAVVIARSENDPPDYMMIDIALGSQSIPAAERTTYYEHPDQLPFPGGVTNEKCKTDYLVLRRCPAANMTFRMGTTPEEHWEDPRWTTHLVTLTNDFWMGVYEVTQRQYQHFCASTAEFSQPSYFTADAAMRPVESVKLLDLRGWNNQDDEGAKIANGTRKVWPETGHEILQFDCSGKWGTGHTNILWLVREITGQQFDLPTDAQWECAARAGRGGNLPDGTVYADTIQGVTGFARVSRMARFKGNSMISDDVNTNSWPAAEGGTAVVGTYAPNAWGLYDVCGNVAEWCLDNYGIFTADSVVDPVGPASPTKTSNQNRSVRGGSWNHDTWYAVLTHREAMNGNTSKNWVGFRLCLTIP